jgi:hypothetical protein
MAYEKANFYFHPRIVKLKLGETHFGGDKYYVAIGTVEAYYAKLDMGG